MNIRHIMPCIALFWAMAAQPANAQDIEYTAKDSIRIEQILQESHGKIADKDAMLYFGRQFLGVPYVGHTLENGTKEHLIVNTRGLDCTTFVETVMALYLCNKYGKTSFQSFCNHLRKIRYRGGELKDYTSRLHYFTWWGEDNEQMGFVRCITSDGFPFTATQRLDINYMSTHPDSYKHLKSNPTFVSAISKLEQASRGKTYKYIPKSLLNRSRQQLSCIHTGDIVAIITNKAGLDTSHVGIAVWEDGKLHLMHASSLYKKVVIDSNTFYDYSKKQTSQLGIRLFRPQ